MPLLVTALSRSLSVKRSNKEFINGDFFQNNHSRFKGFLCCTQLNYWSWVYFDLGIQFRWTTLNILPKSSVCLGGFPLPLAFNFARSPRKWRVNVHKLTFDYVSWLGRSNSFKASRIIVLSGWHCDWQHRWTDHWQVHWVYLNTSRHGNHAPPYYKSCQARRPVNDVGI